MIDNNSSWSSISGYSGTIMQYNNSSSAWSWGMVSGGTGNNYGYGVCCDKTVANGDVYGYSHGFTGQFNSKLILVYTSVKEVMLVVTSGQDCSTKQQDIPPSMVVKNV